MIYFIKNFKGAAYFLAMLVLFQSCVAYKKTPSTIEKAFSEKDMPIKIITKDGNEYKLYWIEEKDGNIVSIKNVKTEYFDKDQILQIVQYDPKPLVISKESSLNDIGLVQILTKDKKDRYKSDKFIKISEQDDIITGYKMTGKDTMTVVIPINQVEKIQLQDKETSSAMTAILIVGVVLGVITIAGLSAMSNSFMDGWDFSQ